MHVEMMVDILVCSRTYAVGGVGICHGSTSCDCTYPRYPPCDCVCPSLDLSLIIRLIIYLDLDLY